MSALRAYCTLAQLRTRQQLAATDTGDDPRLLAKIRAASAEIERYTGRVFQPILEARTFDYQDSLRLSFRGQDLLNLTSLVDGANVTILPTAIILKGMTQSGSAANGPFYGLELDPTRAYLLYITTKTRAISVTGVWGWHDDYANAWIASTLTVSGALDAVTTTIPTSANPTTTADAWGQTPGISAGALVQIDVEWMQVTATSASAITVLRGQNGTTAASHSNAAPISVYQPPKDVQDICLRWASYLYAQDSVDYAKQVTVQMGQTLVPAGLPPDLVAALAPYKRERVG